MHMMSLARGLAERGWEVGLASSGREGEHDCGPEWFEQNGVRHFDVPFPGPNSSAKDLLSSSLAVFKLESALRRFRPAVLHVHWRSTSVFAAAAGAVRRVPFVSTLHAESIPSGGIFRLGSRWGQRAIAVSTETQRSLMAQFGVPEDRITVIYNGVDHEVFRPPTKQEKLVAREMLGLSSNGAVVSLVGRLEPEKNHGVLLRAVQRCLAEVPEIQVVFAGEGSLKKQLEDSAGELGIADRVHFVGHVDSKCVYWASDATVLPSLKEGFGIVVVESMLCSVPVIRTPAGGAADQIADGITGLIVPFGDDRLLAARLVEVLTDHDMASGLAGAARKRALELFTLQTMVSETERVYARTIEGSKLVSAGRRRH